MNAPPGRWHLLTQAAWDARLTTQERLRRLDIAMPAGYSQEAALWALRRSAEARAHGDQYAANQIIEELLTCPTQP